MDVDLVNMDVDTDVHTNSEDTDMDVDIFERKIVDIGYRTGLP